MARQDRKPTLFKLHAGDCVKGMKTLRPRCVDVVVTSPPYNLGIRYGRYQDRLSREKYRAWTLSWGREVKRLLKDRGSFFLNLGAAPANPLAPHELVLDLVEHAGFKLQNTFHWIKSITVETRDGRQISVGHFKPLHSGRYANDCHEYVFHLTPGGDTPLDRLAVGVPYSDKSNIGRWSHTKGEDLRCRGNNWFIPYKTIQSRGSQRPHPATFPVELAARCLKIHGCGPRSVVLDPFLGIGHSALAARQVGVGRFVGFELDPDYLKVARKALKEPAS